MDDTFLRFTPVSSSFLENRHNALLVPTDTALLLFAMFAVVLIAIHVYNMTYLINIPSIDMNDM